MKNNQKNIQVRMFFQIPCAKSQSANLPTILLAKKEPLRQVLRCICSAGTDFQGIPIYNLSELLARHKARFHLQQNLWQHCHIAPRSEERRVGKECR